MRHRLQIVTMYEQTLICAKSGGSASHLGIDQPDNHLRPTTSTSRIAITATMQNASSLRSRQQMIETEG